MSFYFIRLSYNKTYSLVQICVADNLTSRKRCGVIFQEPFTSVQDKLKSELDGITGTLNRAMFIIDR